MNKIETVAKDFEDLNDRSILYFIYLANLTL